MSIKQMKNGVVVPIAGLSQYVDNDEDPSAFVIDETPTDGSNNLVKSGGVKAALDAKQNKLTFDSTPTANSDNPVTSKGIRAAILDMGTGVLQEVQNGLSQKQSALTFDNVPTTGSNNPVKSKGIKAALDLKQDVLTFDSTPTQTSNNPVTSNGIYDAIAAAGSNILKSVQDDLIPNALSDLDLPAGEGVAYTFDTTPTLGSSNPVTSDGIKKAIDTQNDVINSKAEQSNVDALLETIDNKQDKLTFDATPTLGSSNPVTSDGIKKAIDTFSASKSEWKYVGTTKGSNAITLPDDWNEIFICVYLDELITAARFLLKDAIDKMPGSFFNLGGYYYNSNDYEQDVGYVERTNGSYKMGLYRITRWTRDGLPDAIAHYWYKSKAVGGSDEPNSTVILYDSTGQNTDGAMTQKAVTDALSQKANTSDIDNKQDKLTFDTTPTIGSSNPVTSDGIKKAIDEAVGDIPISIPTGETEAVLYSATGQNTDGAMTQKAVTDALSQKANEASVPKLYDSTGQNTDGAMTQKAVTDILGDIGTLLDGINGSA